MAIRFRAFGQEVIIGKRLYGVGKEEDYYTIATRHGTDLVASRKLDLYKGTVYACISLIAESIGDYQPAIYKQTGDKRELLQAHPLLELLKRPSGPDSSKGDAMSQFELFEATASFLELQGEAFWYMVKGSTSGVPRKIILLRPDRVGIDIDKNTGDVNGYFLRRNVGDPIPFDIDEILHFKYYNPRNAYRGLSPLEAAADFIETEDSTVAFTKNFFKNGAGMSGILSLKGEVSKGAFEKFARAWREKHEGTANSGKVAILRESEAKFEPLGLGIDKLDMSALRKMSKDDIAMAFRVPMPLLGKAEETGMGRANVETLEYIFSKYNIDKKMKRIDAVLQEALSRYYNGEQLIMSHANIIPSDKLHDLERVKAYVDVVLSRNEIRDELGLDPAAGGESLRAPMASVPLDEDFSEPTKTLNLTIRRKLVLKKKDNNDTEINTEQKENFRLRLMRNQGKYERRFKRTFKPLLEEQEREALYNLEAKSSSLNKDLDEKLFDDAAADKVFQDNINPVQFSLAEQQGSLALLFAGDEEHKFTVSNKLQSIIERSTKKMAANFNDETLRLLNKTLTEGIVNGEALSKLKKRVEAVYAEARGYRAERLARTETLKASNYSTNDAYRQTGYVKEKQWYVNPGGCDICSEFEGKTVALDDNFAEQGQNVNYTDEEGNEHSYAIDYEDIESPPLHPQCRCTIIPVR